MCADMNALKRSDKCMEAEILDRILQFLNPVPVMKLKNVSSLVTAIAKKPVTTADVKRLLHKLNQHLKWCQLKCLTCDITGVEYVVHVHTYKHFLTITLTRYSAFEKNMFIEIMSKLICSKPIGQMTATDFMNLTTRYYFSVSKAEELLTKLTNDWWLLVQNDNIYFGVRSRNAIPYLFKNFRDFVRVCSRCKFVALTAVYCKNEECSAILHHQCLKKLKLLRPNSYCCLSCGEKLSFD